jgi:pimeloyl-ACP methyl ester carboxylesterase
MKIFLKSITVVAFLYTSLFISSCKDDVESVPKNETLISSTSFLKRSSAELKTFLQVSGLDVPLEEIKYNVEILKVTYHTKYKGSDITASGLVIIPETTDKIGMLSFQHGTISANSEAPTNLPLNSSELIYYSALSTMGFITTIPDYIGFGSSSDITHPYYVEEYTAGAVVDLLKAAKELAREKKLSFNEKLFLAGYSQGGYATMAAHKYIEENGLSGFNLIASFPASGGYDIKGVQEYFFNQDTYDNPYYMAFVARAYQTAYDWSAPLSDFFQEPYASRIPDLFNGSKTADQINAQLTNTVSDLITTDIHANIDTDSKYNYITSAFDENSLTDWTPTIKMYMYHGSADITVPYENSVSVYQNFIDRGASPSVVQLITLEGATHSTGVAPYIEDFIPKVISLR